MLREEFANAFERLLKAFTVQKSEEKGDIYFERLGHYSTETFQRVVSEVIDELKSFPSISELRERLLAKEVPSAQTKQSCLLCDGFGWVSKYGFAFRAPCKHSERLSQKIPLWPLEVFEQRKILQRICDEDYRISKKIPPWAIAEKLQLPEEKMQDDTF